jgi:ribosomal protein L37AE/L43A
LKQKRNNIEISGQTKKLFCPDCKSLLVLDPESKLRKCNKCKKYWKYAGRKKSVVEKRRIGEREKRKEK